MAINKIPGVCGGVAIINKRRIRVSHIIAYMKQGMRAAEIVNTFVLTPTDVIDAIRYYVENKEEIDKDIGDDCE